MEEVGRAYAAVAGRYIELFGSVAQLDADDLELITRRLAIRPGIVLDVGCGPGHITAHLRSLEVDAVGIDLVRDFIDYARAKHPGGGYAIGSLRELPVPAESVAGVLAWYSLIHVPPRDLDAVLTELRRVMVPNATLVAGFFDGELVASFEHKVVTAHLWPVDELADRLKQAGFSEIERVQRGGREGRPHAALVAVADE